MRIEISTVATCKEVPAAIQGPTEEVATITAREQETPEEEISCLMI
jgi:hypothetical protein